MIVHFVASTANVKSEIDNFRLIISTVQDLGHEVARNWIEEGYEMRKSKKTLTTEEWDDIVNENIAALAKSDVVIAEVSSRSFSVGFQMANAVQQKKPVLTLANGGIWSNNFSYNISSDLVRNMSYTKDNVRDIISDFLIDNTIENKDLRFNFFINKKIYNYLRWASYQKNKSKSEILRDLIDREIDKNDY